MTVNLASSPPHQIAQTLTSETVVTSKRVKVCHISLTLKTGGLERLLADFARCHDRAGYEMEFIAIREIGRFAEIIRETGCQLHQLAPARRLGQIRQLVRIFRDRQFDVVHTHNTYPHLYGSIAARWAGIPVVIQTRHGQRSGHGWKSALQYRWAAKLVDRVVAVSEDAAQLTVASDGVPAAKVQTIWNGIDLDDFDYRGPAQTPTAISVARLSAEKDFPTLLRAVRLTVDRVPDFRLKMVGDGPERAKLEALCQDLNLSPQVEFLGDCRNVPELLSSGAFFVSSSLTEGISLTLLEAMAVGLPVIATAVGGNPEIVVQNETGLLVPAGHPQALADAMIEMCQQPSRWRELGLAGRARVAKEFDVRRMVADYQQLYSRLLGEKRQPRQKGR